MAVSNIYLTAGIRENLFSLQRTGTAMERTQNRLATGLKVNSALDDPINFFAAQSHRQRAGDLALLKDSMNEALQTVKAADAGIEGIMELVAQARSVINSALTATDASTYQTQYNLIMDQIADMAEDSFYKGVNLLNNESLDVSFNGGTNTLTIAGADIVAYSLTDADFSDADPANWNDAALITNLDTFSGVLKATSQSLSSNLSIVSSRLDFTQNMINTLNTGADTLTLADMNEESANMLMLQTRQALATSSLGMASDAAQAVLRLF
jgi:flagellin